jgi:hypothetical protein
MELTPLGYDSALLLTLLSQTDVSFTPLSE